MQEAIVADFLLLLFLCFLIAPIWSELGPRFRIIEQLDGVKVQEWETSHFGRVRALVFKTSNGIEGIHKVTCIDDKTACKSDWSSGDQTPVLEYIHTMTMALITVLSGNECPQDSTKEILHVGLGSGTIPSFVEHFVPQWKQTILEISHDVINAPLFGVHEGNNLDIVSKDANKYIDGHCGEKSFSAIVMDAFDPNDKIAECTTNTNAIESCLEPEGIVVVNLVLSDQKKSEEMLSIARTYKKAFSNVIMIESSVYHKVLVASNRREHITHEEFFYRTENLHKVCEIPLLTRGRGYWFDVTQATDTELETWFLTVQHQTRNCRGLNCLMY